MSEIFQFINTPTAQGTGRYTVAAHTEIIISKTNAGGEKKSSPKGQSFGAQCPLCGTRTLAKSQPLPCKISPRK